MSDFKALLQASGEDEAVEVNQRALIEKILARYSGENTVFRELLQNADDAGAECVEIHFRSAATPVAHDKDALPNLKTFNTTSILARNDGVVFRAEDWSRLKKIAEGNPDESKIGAFGVGFSLFSLCDEPVVSSGERVMGFYWKDGKDQLYVKTAPTPAGSENFAPNGKPWTSFLMELREPAPMPEPHDFARFLTTCLGFTAKIKTVSMHFDDHLLFRVTKALAPSRPLSFKPNLATTSPLKILRIEKIEEVPLQLRAEVSRWLSTYASKPKPPAPTLATAAASASAATSSFASKMLAAFSSSRAVPPPLPSRSHSPAAVPSAAVSNPFALLDATLFLRTVSATLKVSPPAHFSQEMVRATKKNLPARTVYSLIWTSRDEFEAGREGVPESGKGVNGVFAGLMSDLDKNGRVFIGFPTFQTTGCAASVAARFVTTVERESVDFQAKYVNEWNRELLWAGGILARTVYEEEMTDIAKLYKAQGDKMDAPTKVKLEERALHLMRFFTFSQSTPSPVVGTETEASFFASAARTSITIISQLGPLPASDVRLPNPALSPFLKAVPTIPPLVETGAPRLLAAYRDKNLVRDISLDDVLADLGAHPLSISEAAACFKWWQGLAANRGYTPALVTKLKDAAMLSVQGDSGPEDLQIYSLGSFKTFLNPSVVPSQLPLPAHTLPFGLTKSVPNADLVRIFGFEELSLVEWAKYLVSPAMTGAKSKAETNLLLSPPFAEKVLTALAKSWAGLTAQRQAEVVGLLAPIPFIPTRQGSRVPGDTYFSNVDLFADLPIVTFPSGAPAKGGLEKVLTALGVRRHVELQLVFTRLLGQGDWSHYELAKYLVGVRDTLSASELERLRQTQWLPKEGEAKVPQPPGPDGIAKKPKVMRHSAKQLFEPTDTFRALGLPVLDWSSAPQKWRPSSDEAKFLLELGLLRTPSVEQLLQIAATPGNAALQDKALRYFLDEYSNASYGSSYSPSKHAFAFLPAMQRGSALFAKPTEVFSNPAVALLGFPVLVGRLHQDAGRLKVAADPPPALLVAALLKSPPADVETAQAIFGYLSTQVSQFSQTQIVQIRGASIVPVIANARPEHRSPSVCFFSTDPSLPPGLKTLFTVLPDFGFAAKPFLTAVGVKESPSTSEIAAMVIENPGKLLDLSGSAERYLSVLRMLAANHTSLSWSLQKQMKSTALFLGTKRVPAPNGEATLLDDDDDESSGKITYQLARASSLCINDEPHTFRVFETDVLACPQEELLEDFAEAMGAQRISGLVTSNYRTSGVPDEHSQRAVALRRAIAERTSLFLLERVQQHGKSELKYEVDWISSHLLVYEVSSIELVLTLNFNGVTKRVAQPASAYVKADRSLLSLFCGPDDMDFYYEAASGLCKFLLVKQRPNDCLLLMTVLQTSLQTLKRRGYNVDRILNARQAAKEKAEARFKEERRLAQISEANQLSGDKLSAATDQLGQLFPDADPAHLRSVLQKQQPPHVQNAANVLLSSDYPRRNKEILNGVAPQPPAQGAPPVPASAGRKDSYDSGLFSQFKKKIRSESKGELSRNPGGSAAASAGAAVNDALSRIKAPQIPRPATGSMSSSGGPGTPSSTDAIRQNVAKAVQAARPESSNNISNEVTKTQVREESSYCDSTGAANLTYIQDVAGLRFYCDKAVPSPQAFAQEHLAALTRFITLVLRPVGEVFTVDPRSLHVFHDLDSPLIAFNRGGAIYFNSRYYFAWHDAEVVSGQLHNALISVYHSLAHELAHNLVQPHDAQHSFYFSSLAETYFLRMAQLLARSSA